MAPRVRFALYDFSADGSTIVLPASFETWLDDVCSKGGATVVNMSFGSVYADGKYDGFAAMVDSIVRRRPKCSVNIACGNDGPDGLCSSPSTCKNGISWGAAMARPEAYPQFDVSKNPELYDATYAIKFSSRGPLKDGRRAPLLHSTGVEVLAALGYSVPVAGHADFFKLSGTSFASPAGAGVVAVVQSDYASKNGGEIPSASLVIARLIASAEQMRGTVTLSNGAAVVLDGAKTNTGYGVPRSPVGAGIDYESSIADGQRRTFCFVANEASKRISVGAAWTVPAGLPGTDFLVNDLDFRFLRNGATVGFSKNSVDPNEKFVVEDVVAGEYFKLVAFEKDSKTAGGLPQTFSVSVLGEGLTRSPLCEKDDGCLPDDKSACTNGIRVCDAYSGKFSDECMTTKCSVNGGPNCTTTTSELSCSVPFGKGKISAGDGKCVPTSCDENYVVSESSCVCAPDLEIVCPSAPAFKKCGKDGKYSSCPSLVSSPTPPQSQTTSTAAAGVDASFSTSLAVAAFSLFVSL